MIKQERLPWQVQFQEKKKTLATEKIRKLRGGGRETETDKQRKQAPTVFRRENHV
jgi:hypothetical protein